MFEILTSFNEAINVISPSRHVSQGRGLSMIYLDNAATSFPKTSGNHPVSQQ